MSGQKTISSRTADGVTPVPVQWLEIAAGIASLIGIVGLLALMSEGAWAEPPGNGFGRGAKSFSNPFVAPGGANKPANAFPEDDASDDAEFADDVPAAAPPSPGRGGAPASAPVAERQQDVGTSMGGTPPSGVISHNKAPAFHVNDETGEGSKEIVTDFNFPDADIMDIAKTLSKLTGKNLIVDKDVKGRITIISNSAITVGDAWKAFLTALDINGFALIPSGKYIRVARQRDARDKQLKTYTGDYSPDTDALITRVFPLKYISSEEVARTFRSFMPANSRIIPYEQTNTVIVTDTGSNIAKLARMLEILDVEGYDAGIEVIPVKYASAAELSKLIDTLIPGTSNTAGAAPGGGPRFGGGGGGRFTARRTKEGGIINTIISDERTNTLIVHANTRGADQVRELVAKLDQKLPAQTGGGKVHVVYLQFADAEGMATTLNNLSSQAGGGFKSTGAGGGGTGVNPVAGNLFEGNIKVAPDKATNSLVITASPSDFVTVQRVINRLDIPRDEVYVEVVIMEIIMTRDFQFSTNVINPSSGIGFTPNSDLATFLANPLGLTGAIIGFKAGSTQNITIGTQTYQISNVQGLIRTIQTNSNGNILATPQILTLDNTEATFESSELIPYPTVTAIQGSTSTSVSKERVSLSITIKPQINKLSNFVKLDVTSKLADLSNRVLPSAVANLAFATTERNAKTSVVVADSDTVILGGLIRDKQSETVSKIPILGDIPLLGWLFRAKTSTIDKTNLLIFITPHIIRQYDTIRATLDRKLKERDDFIETNSGGNDPMRKYRDEIIRSLPDIKEITSKRPQATVTIDEDQELPTESHIGTPPPAASDQKGAVPVIPNTPTGTPQSAAPQVMPPSNVAPPAEPNGVTPPPTIEPPTAPVPPPPAPNGGGPSS